MCKEDLPLNNLQGLRCHKTQLNKTKIVNYWLINCVFVYKQDFALDNPQGLVCHKTKQN